jgi:hypothetical protein
LPNVLTVVDSTAGSGSAQIFSRSCGRSTGLVS